MNSVFQNGSDSLFYCEIINNKTACKPDQGDHNMPHKTLNISAKTVGFLSALIVPMLLIPSTGQAKSPRTERDFFSQNSKVKSAQGDKTYNQRSYNQFFDGAAPRKKSRAMSQSRMQRANRGRLRDRQNSRRRGYRGDYYGDDFAKSCVSPRQIHKRLHRQGWRNFHNLRVRPNVLAFKARQSRQGREANDLTYNLRIDRCTGALIKAKLQRQPFGQCGES